MHPEKGIEDLVLKNTTTAALERFSDMLTWPQHLSQEYPDPKANIVNALRKYFSWSKGSWGLADYLAQCAEDEIPRWMRDTCIRIRELSQSPPGEESARDEPELVEMSAEPGATSLTADESTGDV